jgi:hypothetical protein
MNRVPRLQSVIRKKGTHRTSNMLQQLWLRLHYRMTCVLRSEWCVLGRILRLFWLETSALIELILIAPCLLRFCDEYVCEGASANVFAQTNWSADWNEYLCSGISIWQTGESHLQMPSIIWHHQDVSIIFTPTLAPPQLQMSCGNTEYYWSAREYLDEFIFLCCFTDSREQMKFKMTCAQPLSVNLELVLRHFPFTFKIVNLYHGVNPNIDTFKSQLKILLFKLYHEGE